MLNLLEMRCLSSLAKVFPDEDIQDPSFHFASALGGETFSFQVAYRALKLAKRLHISVDTGDLETPLMVRVVGVVPSQLPCYDIHNTDVLRSTPGFYPDPLFELKDMDEIFAYPDQWRSIWVTMPISYDTVAGEYVIKIKISGKDDSTFGGNQNWYGEQNFRLQVIPCNLPKQSILHTEWFYTDCIATWYGFEPFTTQYWGMVDKYMKNAALHGINMLLTPIFTPPLETKVNTERLTVQLIDIQKNGDEYAFDFTKLGQWIEMCKKNNIQYLEIAHLFTQWGAYHAPQIIVSEKGAVIQQFGWETDASGKEYILFLEQLLPSLVSYLEDVWMKGRFFFHISDEPGADRLEDYCKLCKKVSELTGGYPILDALSELELFKRSDLSIPVAATDAIDGFIEEKTPNLWAYYACLQYRNALSNRFFNFPSYRNRILGIQLYRYDIKGFLHWGYNHWYSGISETKVNPFITTDANACFPSGDAFLVYPGNEGPIDSIRSEVLHEAFQDYRALKLLEAYTDRESVIAFLEEDIPPITFQQYPHGANWLLGIREKINNKLLKLSKERNK